MNHGSPLFPTKYNPVMELITPAQWPNEGAVGALQFPWRPQQEASEASFISVKGPQYGDLERCRILRPTLLMNCNDQEAFACCN